MTTKRSLAGVAVMLTLTTGTLFAQSRKGEDTNTRSVEGRVLDKADAPAAHAVVQIKDTKTLQIRSFNTQDDGAYHFAGLSSNVDYELKAERDGASSGVKTLSVFDSHKTANIDLKLK